MECTECELLWSKYAQLIERQTDLLSQYFDAVKSRELGKLQELEGALALADNFRNTSREILMGHRTMNHRNGSNGSAAA